MRSVAAGGRAGGDRRAGSRRAWPRSRAEAVGAAEACKAGRATTAARAKAARRRLVKRRRLPACGSWRLRRLRKHRMFYLFRQSPVWWRRAYLAVQQPPSRRDRQSRPDDRGCCTRSEQSRRDESFHSMMSFRQTLFCKLDGYDLRPNAYKKNEPHGRCVSVLCEERRGSASTHAAGHWPLPWTPSATRHLQQLPHYHLRRPPVLSSCAHEGGANRGPA